MSGRESRANTRLLAAAVRDLRVTQEDGTEVDDQAVVKLSNAHTLHLRVEFDSLPTATRYRVTLVIYKRGRSSAAHSGEIRNSPTATTFTQTVNVMNSPPRLEFDVVDDRRSRFHDGPGPYDTTIALTPVDSGGTPVESETSSMSYDFVGV